MNPVIEKIHQANQTNRVITESQLSRLLNGTPQRRYNLVNRALQAETLHGQPAPLIDGWKSMVGNSCSAGSAGSAENQRREMIRTVRPLSFEQRGVSVLLQNETAPSPALQSEGKTQGSLHPCFLRQLPVVNREGVRCESTVNIKQKEGKAGSQHLADI